MGSSGAFLEERANRNDNIILASVYAAGLNAEDNLLRLKEVSSLLSRWMCECVTDRAV